jgi:tRNA guanosine-2'-O-methyltransferase
VLPIEVLLQFAFKQSYDYVQMTNILTASHKIIAYQYSRYCSVFETLVLARYTNLVVECERDLDLLASTNSIIQSKWLYVLFATALDATTTDQNRKFIGEWIMRSDLFARFPDGLADFMSHSFLPWSMEGHLFVSSTKVHDGQSLSSRHGDRFSTFVGKILSQTSADARAPLLDAMFDFLVRKYTTLFAYSAVHLIRGISNAFETSDDVTLNKVQFENLLFISALRTLPEVATDYLVVQCWRICSLSESRSEKKLANELTSIGQTRLQDLTAAAEIIKQNVTSTDGTAISSPNKSQRDVKIQASVEKCKNLLLSISTEATQLQQDLEDIWSDLEFLEYPRALLVKLPAVFFNPTVFRVAFEENGNDDAGLRELVVITLPRLLDIANRRSFLLAPLMASLRQVVLAAPQAATILDLEECILKVCQSPPEPGIDLRMEYSAIPLLSSHLDVSADACRDHYFGKGEGYGFAAYLDLISRIGTQQPNLIQSLLETLLARWKRQKVPTPTISAWKTTLQLEVMLLCFEQFAATAPRTSLDPMLKDFYFILSLEPLPRFRYLMEWTLVRIQIRHPDLCSQTLDMLATKDHQSNPKFLASLMKMGVMLATAKSGTEDFARSLATTFIALSSSSKIIIRHESQWAFPQLMDHARSQEWTTILINPAYTALDEYIRSLPRFGDPPPERIMSKIDPVTDHTMTNLVEGLWTDLDYTRPPYTTHQDFVTLYKDDATLPTTAWPASCIPLGSAIPKPLRLTTSDGEDPSTQKPKPMTQEEAIALQTKGTAYLKTSLDDDSQQKNNKHSLLVVASLIENPLNLGGLSRASEIFGAQAMYVRDPRVIAEKDFTSVAVSSHNHIDIMPLPVPEISAWAARMKSEGWTVVGIEQTDRSVLLGGEGAVLPDKTILVLGSEREGMPAAVLGECDLLVEIPQVGVTRSLNVQVAAAIVLFEYGRQHGGK